MSWANYEERSIVDATADPGDKDGWIAIVSTFTLDGVEHKVIGNDAREVRKILARYIAAARLLD